MAPLAFIVLLGAAAWLALILAGGWLLTLAAAALALAILTSLFAWDREDVE